MQVSPYKTWDAVKTLSNSEFRTLSERGCRKNSIRQRVQNFIRMRVQETLYQTGDARVSIRQRMQEKLLSDRRCRILYIKQRMQESLFVFVALRPMSTAMVIAGWSVHLTTLFPGQA